MSGEQLSYKLLTKLQGALRMLEVELPFGTQEKLINYIEIVTKWNQTHNLTAPCVPEEFLVRHVIDSLAIMPFVQGGTILDFGSGAGLPGIPLALALPHWHFVLLDSSQKKCSFLQYVKLLLGLDRVTVASQRLAEFSFPKGFATIVTRATTTVTQLLSQSTHLWGTNTQVLIMKGKYPAAELAQVNMPVESYQLKVPYLNAARHLIRVLT